MTISYTLNGLPTSSSLYVGDTGQRETGDAARGCVSVVEELTLQAVSG